MDSERAPIPERTSQRPLFRRRMRVLHRLEFEAAFAGTRPRYWRNFGVRCFQRPADGRGPRLGLVVGKRVGNAPRRNRIKRRIRELFRELAVSLQGDMDVIVIAIHRDAAVCDFATLRHELTELVERARRPTTQRGDRRGRRGTSRGQA